MRFLDAFVPQRDPGLATAIEEDAVRQTVAYYRPSLNGTILATVTFVAAIWPGPGANRLLLWALTPLLAIAAIGVMTIPHARLISAWGVKNWSALLAVGFSALGTTWGLTFWLTPVGGNPDTHALLALVFILAQSAGGLIHFAGFRRLAVAMFTPMWGLAAIHLATLGQYQLMLGCAAFYLVILGFNRLAHQMHVTSSTFRHEAQSLAAELRRSETEARAIVRHAAEAIWAVEGPELRILEANPTAEALARSLLGTRPDRLTDLLSGLGEAMTAKASINGSEYVIKGQSGRSLDLLVSASWIDELGGRATVIARDITQRKRLESRLQHDATHDSLTGLANRTGALTMIRIAMAAGRRPAVLFIDLDRFKQVNDQLGHRVGDQVLTVVSDRLHEVCPPQVQVARLGGDEFVIVAPHVKGVQPLERLARAVIAALEKPIPIGNDDAEISATIGIAIFDGEGDEVDLISRADLAMYQGKVDGRRTTVVFDRALQRHVEARVQLEHGFRHALSHGDVHAWGQPIIDLSTSRLVAVELLARWRRDGGFVQPDVFIPIAEETGLVVDLGRQMLDRAVDLLASWRSTPFDNVRVSVNIGARHLRGRQLLVDLEAAVRRHPIDRSLLVVELTETQIADEPATAPAQLRAVRELGCGLAIDDFGTGYSSLSSLVELPLNIIKIDRSFVAGLLTDRRQRAVVEAVVMLGERFGHHVVAEGVESPEQVELLRSLGVKLGQGFLFTPPLPLAELQQWAERSLAIRGAVRPDR